MVKVRVAPMLGVLLIAAFLVGACSSSKSKSSSAAATTAVVASKAAFCADNDKLNSAFSNATAANIVAAVRTNLSLVDDFGKVAPPQISSDAQVLVAASHDAVTANDSGKLKTSAVQTAGTNVDTFCGTGGSTTTTTPGGTDTTILCTNNAKINADLAKAGGDPAKGLAALKADQTAIADFAGASAPLSLQQDITTLSTAANDALNNNDFSRITTPAVQTAAQNVNAVCGQNADGTPSATTASPSTTA